MKKEILQCKHLLSNEVTRQHKIENSYYVMYGISLIHLANPQDANELHAKMLRLPDLCLRIAERIQ